jgi:inner membrane protein
LGKSLNYAGIVISCFYILFSFASHSYADHTFKRQLEARNVKVLNSITGATPLNTFLWRHIARTEEGILIGYFSIIGNRPDEEIRFDLVRRNENLIEPYQDQRNVQVIKWFSKGFWVAEKKNGVLTLSDLRFGEFRFKEDDPPDKWQYVFVWEISDNPDLLSRKTPAFRDSGAAITLLWKRLNGAIQ